MARPQKEGLEYFPLDVDIDQDDKVALIEAQHGATGFAVVIKLLMKIYKNSYFYEWTEKEQLLFSKRINVDINSINVIINDCVKWGLFDNDMLKKHNILTSRGIQRRYLKASERRQRVEIEEKYLLLDDEEVNVYKNLVIVNINDCSTVVNDNINPQSKVKESKVKNSRVEESRKEDPTAADTDYKNVIDFFNNNIHPVTPVEAEKLKDWLNDMESDVIIQAIEEAVIYNKRNYGYIATILNARLKHGIRTKQHLDAYLRDRKDIKNKDAPRKGAFKAPVTTFNSYNQRSYDMDELEKKLLGRE